MIDNISIQLPSFSLQRGNASSARADDKFKSKETGAADSLELSEEEKAHVEELKKIDQEVRTHEAAHKNAGGQYASGPTYTYTVGPDNQRYATGGEVQIDSAAVEGDPEATVAKMDVVIAAALAPAKPSAQDRKVAAEAVATRNKAQAELLSKKRDEQSGDDAQQISFDVNNFGNTPLTSVNKAYETGLGLTGDEADKTGNNFSVSS